MAIIVAALALLVALYVGSLLFTGASFGETSQPVRPLTCHTVTPQTYNRAVRKLDRITGIRHRRAKHKRCKHGDFKRLQDRIDKLCRPKHVVTGRVSYFNDSQTYTGISAASHEGLAVNIAPGTDWGWNNSRVRRWADSGQRFIVELQGRKRKTRIIDLGPAGSTGRALDFSAPLANAMGWGSNFPTDSIGRLYLIRKGC